MLKFIPLVIFGIIYLPSVLVDTPVWSEDLTSCVSESTNAGTVYTCEVL